MQFWDFRHLRLPVKFAIAMVLFLLGLGFLSYAYYQTISLEEKGYQRTENLLEFVSLTDNVESNISKAQFYASQFFASYSQEDLDNYNSSVQQAHIELDLLAPFIRSEEDRALVSEFTAAVTNYHHSFHDASDLLLASGLYTDDGIAQELRELVRQETPIYINSETILDEPWKVDRFQLLRVQVDGFIGTRGEYPAVSLIETSFTDLTADIEEFEQELDSREALLEGTNSIRETFSELSRAVERSSSQYSQAAEIVPTLAPLIQQLKDVATQYRLNDRVTQRSSLSSMFNFFLGSMGFMIVAMAIAISVFKYGIMDPVAVIRETLARVREGDESARSNLEQRDEVGELGTVLDNLLSEKESALAVKEEENKRLNDSIIELIKNVFRLSQRDLTVRVPVAEDVTGAIADSINQLSGSIHSVLADVRSVAHRVTDTSEQVKSQSETVLTYANQEQVEIEQTLQGLDSAIKAMELISKLAMVSNSASQKAIKTSETAMESVSQTVDSINKIRQTIHEAEKRIKRLGERSQEIGGIVGLINNISERTHVLSLNASMHAASAGEAGRGLMVVVDEVQRLAENSREATAEIESLVSNIQLETADTMNVMNAVISDVVEGTRLAEEAGERMGETRVTTQTLVESVVRIAQNAVKQARVAEQLRERANSIDESSAATNAQMKQQATLSDDLVSAAAELEESISVFTLADAK